MAPPAWELVLWEERQWKEAEEEGRWEGGRKERRRGGWEEIEDRRVGEGRHL